MYKKILVPYDKSDPAKNALGAALDLAAGVPGAQITVLSVVDWHDFNAETFKIASRMSGVMGDTMDMDVISEVENEAIKADMDAIAENIAPLVGDAEGIGIAVVNGSPHDSITAYADGCIGLHAPIRVRYGKEIDGVKNEPITTASSWAIAAWVPCVACSVACAIPCCTRPTCPCSL